VLTGDEALLLFHLDALQPGGERMVGWALRPALEDGDFGVTAAAGYVLFTSGTPESLDTLWERLLETPEARSGLLRALALGTHPRLDAVLLQRLPSAPEDLVAPLLTAQGGVSAIVECLAWPSRPARLVPAQEPPQSAW